MINKRALEKAISDTMREQFAAQMREFLCYGAPKEITELYKRYIDECEAAERRRKKYILHAVCTLASCICVFIFILAMNKL